MMSGTLSSLRAMTTETYQKTTKVFGYNTKDVAHLMVSHDFNAVYCPMVFGCTCDFVTNMMRVPITLLV